MNNKHVSLWGRTYDEYARMFCLNGISPSVKILSIADGPSTFNLQGKLKGLNITSVDPIYNLEVEDLKEAFQKSYGFNKDLFYTNKDRFIFQSDDDIEEVLSQRQNTFNEFLYNYENNGSNYQYGSLPSLSFEADTFEVCLCSNLLFIFDHVFDLQFHLDSISEMLRISKEVRIFPLYDISGQQSNFLDPVTHHLTSQGHMWTIEINDYHIYKNGNRFFKITKAEK